MTGATPPAPCSLSTPREKDLPAFTDVNVDAAGIVMTQEMWRGPACGSGMPGHRHDVSGRLVGLFNDRVRTPAAHGLVVVLHGERGATP
jgi:hypothetical protein